MPASKTRQRPVEFRRFLPLAAVTATVILGFVLVNLLMTLAVGRWPYLPRVYWSEIVRHGGALATVERRRLQGKENNDLVVVLGLSSVNEGLDPAVLRQADGGQRTWLVMAGQGDSIAETAFYAKTLVHSRLEPSLVVIGLHPFHLGEPERATLLSELTERARRWSPGSRLLDTKRLVWSLSPVFYNAGEGRAKALLYTARMRLSAACGLSSSKSFRPNGDETTTKYYVPPGASIAAPGKIQSQIEKYHMHMMGEAHTYKNRQTMFLSSLIEDISAISPRIVVVIMPEVPEFREAYDPQAFDGLTRNLAFLSSQHPITIVDMLDDLDQELFWDSYHANEAGREQLSRLFVSRLQDLGG